MVAQGLRGDLGDAAGVADAEPNVQIAIAGMTVPVALLLRAVRRDRLFRNAGCIRQRHHSAGGERPQRLIEEWLQAAADVEHDVGPGQRPGVGRAQ